MKACLRKTSLILLLLLLTACNTATEETPEPSSTEAASLNASTPATLPTTTPPATASVASTATSAPTATSGPPTRTPIPADTMIDINALEDFSIFFDEDAARTRLVLVLATSCSSCLAGARWLEEEVLSANADANIQVYAVWFPLVPGNMLPSDLSGRRDESVLNDPRVIHFWDRQRVLNQWLAANAPLQGPERSSLRRTYGDLDWGAYIWDAYFIYEPGTTWEAADSPLASGYPLIQNRENIRTALGVNAGPLTTMNDDAATVYRILPTESFVFYGVRETFVGRDVNYAIGATNNITGAITLDRDNPPNSEVEPIVVNIRDFSSDNFLRDDRIRTEFLESNRYPLATFTPSAIRGLPGSYAPGETVEFEMDGDLEVRGVAVPTTFAVTARLEDGRLVGAATTQILMTDFGFEPPAIADLIAAGNEVDITFEFVAVPES